MIDKPLWGGRFSGEPAEAARLAGSNPEADMLLAPHDIRASIAHVRALEDAGIVSPEDATAIEQALEKIGDRPFRDVFKASDEDIHLAHERNLAEELGDVGAKIHAGRSRNDLVVTDFRLWLLEQGNDLAESIGSLAGSLSARAAETAEMPMPGSTHNRPAQVVTMGYVLAAHAFGLVRDLERLAQWSSRTRTSPLGAGALATSTLGLDPAKTAERLGFDRPFLNALDAVSDRDFALEFLAVASILAVHLSRIAADLARWSEPAHGYVELDEAFTTGSSMMPQKRNPDVLELVRGKAGRIAGDLTALTQVLAGLPSGYHRDLQEDKQPVFDAVSTLKNSMPALTGCIETAHFDAERMRSDAEDPELYATDIAEALVKSGLPFREAHMRIGEVLKRLDEEKRTLRDLSSDEWANLGLPAGSKMLDPDSSVRARNMPGGPAPERVLQQCDAIRAALSSISS
ncbi:MAG: argininosuccinate lyase [Actinomycetota bacterium]